ncbi:MAG: hypothetical protein ACKOWK_03705 [Micrococcales bacterium]
MTKTNESERSRKLWIRVSAAIAAVLALSIGGVVYVGTTVVPAQNAANDASACKTFLTANNDAALAFVKAISGSKSSTSVITGINKYVPIIEAGVHSALGVATPKGAVATGLLAVSSKVATLDKTSDVTLNATFGQLYNAVADNIVSCKAVLKKAHIPAPTIDPSALGN